MVPLGARSSSADVLGHPQDSTQFVEVFWRRRGQVPAAFRFGRGGTRSRLHCEQPLRRSDLENVGHNMSVSVLYEVNLVGQARYDAGIKAAAKEIVAV